ncbi:MAG: sodium:proton antiporter [Planctomycetes bacterium]|nr:sodium:proton antiporter [Planctomycetota bacterium]
MGDTHLLLVELAGVVALGVGSQWVAWRLAIPSVVVLLAAGFLAGPLAGVIQPERLLGDLLFPFVSLAVSLILFEGGLSLRFSELRVIRRALWGLMTAGVLATWVLAGLGAWLILGMSPPVAALLGAILTVSGPTVVGPLLRHIRPVGNVGPVAKWEGIIVDPIGAILAVLVLEAVGPAEAKTLSGLTGETALSLVRTIAAGLACGFLAAAILIVLLQRYWIPDYLDSPVALGVVVAAFAAANHLQHEAGLVAVTLAGIVMANQKSVQVQHIMRFKEDLTVLLISVLFILLAARVRLDDVAALGWRSALFVAWLVAIVRPTAVLLSTIGSELSRGERAFLAWFAPRGIVAAAVSSIFALRLGPASEGLVPVTFVVIVSTVAIYGLTARLLARRLGLAPESPQGVLFAGAYAGARAIALALKAQGLPVRMVDTNRDNIRTAQLEGLPCRYGNIVSEALIDEMDLGGIGRMAAITRNDDVNSLAALHFAEIFGRAEVYQLAPMGGAGLRTEERPRHLRGRILFASHATYDELERRFAEGHTVKATPLTEEFDFAAFQTHYGEDALPLFSIRDGRLIVYTDENSPSPKPGQILVSLVQEPRSSQPQT